MANSKKINRREFLGTAAAASLAFTVVPRQVLGGPGYVAPSDKITLGYVGCGTQGLREMTALISNPALQIVAVCDPNKFSNCLQASCSDSAHPLLYSCSGTKPIVVYTDCIPAVVSGYGASSLSSYTTSQFLCCST